MASDSDSNQTNFFIERHKLDTAPPQFAEISTALYERELAVIASGSLQDANRLKQKLRGLPHHVKRAAHYMSGKYSPLTVDSHNASWLDKQPGKCPADKTRPQDNQKWFAQYATYGLVVCVAVSELNQQTIELDSVDRIDADSGRLHVNKFGWFDYDGTSHNSMSSPYSVRRLCRPNKALVTAACCGHQWNHKGKIPPRPLTLREILLATALDWHYFRYPIKPSGR